MKDLSVQSTESPVVDLSLDAPKSINLSDEEVYRRATQNDMALGDASPGVESLVATLKSPGGEEQVKQMAVAKDSVDKQQAAQEAIRTTENLTPELLQGIVEKSQQPSDTDAILEKMLARQLVNHSVANASNPQELNNVDPNTADIWMKGAEDNIARTAVIDKIFREENATYDQMGYPSFFTGIARQALPFLSWYNEYSGNAARGWLMGTNKESQYREILTLPPSEMERAIRAKLAELKSGVTGNQLDANDWIAGLHGYAIQGGYSGRLDNFFSAFDLATFTPWKTLIGAAKGAGTALTKEAAGRAAIRAAEKNTPKTAEELALKKGENYKVVEDITPEDLQHAGAKFEDIKKYRAEQHLKNTLERLDAAAAMPKAEADHILAAVGKIGEAAQLKAAKIAEGMSKEAPKTMKEGVKDLVQRLPSMFNIEGFGIRSAIAHYPKAERIVETWDRVREEAIKAIANRTYPDRSPEAVQRAAVEKMAIEEAKRFKDIKDTLLDVRPYVASENPITKTAGVEIKLGNTASEWFTGEGAREVADNTARELYGLPKGSYDILQEGDGYAIYTRRDLDETTDAYRSNILNSENQSNARFNKIMGVIPVPKVLNSYKDAVSPFLAEQRAAATHAATLNQLFVENLLPSLRKLSNAEAKRLQKIMNVNKDIERNGKRGAFFNTVGELEEAYILHNKSLPTENEVEAYFNYVLASDLDWMGRSFGLLTGKSRSGIRKMEAILNGKPTVFEGKFVDKLPNDARLNGAVWFAPDSKAEGKYFKLNDVRLHDQVNKLLKDGKVKIIHTYAQEDAILKEATGAHGPINFVVVPSAKDGALSLSDQLPYRPGFHVKYSDPYFIKIPRVARDSAGRLVYYGDQAVMGMSSKTKAEKYAQLLEEAKAAYFSKDQKLLDAVISKGLPMTKRQIEVAFKDIDPKMSFGVVPDGTRLSDSSIRLANGKSLQEHVGDSFADFSDNPLDISRGYNMEYTGSKDVALWSIDETRVAGDTTKFPQLVDAASVNPMSNQIEALQKLMHDRFYGDLKIASAESFVEEFGVRQGLLKVGGKTVTRDELRRNPLHYLTNGVIDRGNFSAQAQTARQVQRAAIDLLRQPGLVARQMDHITNLLREGSYRVGDKIGKGDAAVKFFNGYVEPILQTNLPQKLRALAFHQHLGMFNVGQVFLQAQTGFVISVLNPTHGPAATFAGAQIRRMMMLEGDLEAQKAIAKATEKVLPGWTANDLMESKRLMDSTGWGEIKGDYGALDVAKEPKLYSPSNTIAGAAAKEAGGKILEWSPVFFNETERMVRLAAWNTAYKEFVTKFPGAKLDSTAAKKMLSRAQDLSVNMTRDANAFWQHGAMSMMTQFWGYTGRMFDILTGKRISTAEKTRLYMWNAMTYGIPMGLNAGISPIYPWQDKIREMMYSNNIDPNSGVADLVMNGILASTISALGGHQYNISDRWGPQGIQVLWNLMHTKDNETALDQIIAVLGGASGSDALGWFQSMAPIVGDIKDIITGEGSGQMLGANFLNALRNISTVNNSVKAFQAATTGTYVSKKGFEISEGLDGWDALFTFITGAGRQSEKDSFIKSLSIKNQQEAIADAKNSAQKYLNAFWDAKLNGNEKIAEEVKGKIFANLKSAGMRDDQIADFIMKSGKKGSMLESNNDKYVKAGKTLEEKKTRRAMENE